MKFRETSCIVVLQLHRCGGQVVTDTHWVTYSILFPAPGCSGLIFCIRDLGHPFVKEAAVTDMIHGRFELTH